MWVLFGFFLLFMFSDFYRLDLQNGIARKKKSYIAPTIEIGLKIELLLFDYFYQNSSFVDSSVVCIGLPPIALTNECGVINQIWRESLISFVTFVFIMFVLCSLLIHTLHTLHDVMHWIDKWMHKLFILGVSITLRPCMNFWLDGAMDK